MRDLERGLQTAKELLRLAREEAQRNAPPKKKQNRSALSNAVKVGDHDEILVQIELRSAKSDDGCWIWQGAAKDNYPGVTINGQRRLAHRLSLEAFLRQPLGAQPAHHICAVTMCVNPLHLQPVTTRENNAEMMARVYMVQRIRDLEARLAPLQATIAQLDSRIGARWA